VDAVRADAENKESAHDMGGNIITMLVESGKAAVYDFARNKLPGETERDKGYWRDVGTLDSYWEANMDLISVHPVFNLYNREWPIHTGGGSLPPRIRPTTTTVRAWRSTRSAPVSFRANGAAFGASPGASFTRGPWWRFGAPRRRRRGARRGHSAPSSTRT
jgi:hypothetical protein